jgi:hypothetical protein
MFQIIKNHYYLLNIPKEKKMPLVNTITFGVNLITVLNIRKMQGAP